jgi:hypothetical protein
MADPRIWGSDMWAGMHRISLAYPINPSRADRAAAFKFFESIGYLLPCVGCRHHYQKHFKETFSTQTTSSRIALVRWVYDLHETVNARLGKPLGQVALADLPTVYGEFPMRYIDQTGEKLLETPRYTNVGRQQCQECNKNVKLSEKVATLVAAPAAFTQEALDTQNQKAWVAKSRRKTAIISTVLIGFVCLALIVLISVMIYVFVKEKSAENRLQLTDNPTIFNQKKFALEPI